MNYKKTQTTIKPDGRSLRPLELGWVASTRLDADMEDERQRFSRLALMATQKDRPDRAIQTVEVTSQAVVVIYESGEVRIVHYIPEEKS